MMMMNRVQLWVSLVWPQILLRVPFMNKKQAEAIQVEVNKSLRVMSVRDASPELLAAEFGILPIEVVRLTTSAKLYFNLESSPAPLLGALIHEEIQKERAAGTLPGPIGGPEGRFEFDLRELGLQRHFPSPQSDELSVSRARDQMAQDQPRSPQASPLFPMRHSWKQLVKAAARSLASRRIVAWAKGNLDSSRGADWLREKPPAPDGRGWDLDKRASWMDWKLPAAQEHMLLSLRAHGSSLQRHRPSSRWQGLHYQELFCPLCATDHGAHTPEHSEHLLTGCEALSSQRQRLDEAAQAYLSRWPLVRESLKPHGPKKGKATRALPVVWRQLPCRLRTQLLLGYPPVGTGAPVFPLSPVGKTSRDAWSAGLVKAVAPLMLRLLKDRNSKDKANDSSGGKEGAP